MCFRWELWVLSIRIVTNMLIFSKSMGVFIMAFTFMYHVSLKRNHSFSLCHGNRRSFMPNHKALHTVILVWEFTTESSKVSISSVLLIILIDCPERNRRSGRQHPSSTRRMVALYDYDPRESSPNVDVEVLYC